MTSPISSTHSSSGSYTITGHQGRSSSAAHGNSHNDESIFSSSNSIASHQARTSSPKEMKIDEDMLAALNTAQADFS